MAKLPALPKKLTPTPSGISSPSEAVPRVSVAPSGIPIDRVAVCKAASTGKIVVAQDHNIVGGLGDAIASVLIAEGLCPKYKVLGIPDRFVVMAHAPFLYHKYGMDEDGMYFAMKELLND